MIEYVVFSDLHMYKNFSRSYMRDDGLTSWVLNQIKVIDQIKEYGTLNNINMIIFNGDLFEERSRIPQDLYNLTWDKFKELSKSFNIIMNTGNHDKTKISNNSLRPFSDIVTVVTESRDFEFGSTLLRIIPHGKISEDNLTMPDKHVKCILFIHEDINGLKYGKNDYKSQSPLDPELFKSWNSVVNGHIHTPQMLGSNILNIGSCMKHDFGDGEDDERYFYHFKDEKIIKQIEVDCPNFISINGLSNRIKNKMLEDSYNYYRVDISPEELSDSIFKRFNVSPNIVKQNEMRENRLSGTKTIEEEMIEYIRLSESKLDTNKLLEIGEELLC